MLCPVAERNNRVNMGIDRALKNGTDYVIFAPIAFPGKSQAAYLVFLDSERFSEL